MGRARVRTPKRDGSIRPLLALQGSLMAALAAVAIAFGGMGLQQYFILSYVGLVVLILVAGPIGDPPRGWRVLRAAVLVCGLAFGYLLALELAAVR